MKSRSDIFYLLPERSCVPDSPVWYSTSPLPSLQLDKMLQRIMITREVKVLALVALVVLDNMNVFIVEMADVIVAMIMVVIVVVKMKLYHNNKKCASN